MVQIDRSSQDVPIELFVKLISFENQYFSQTLNDQQELKSPTSLALELITQINLGDIRSFIGNELPGYALYDTKILVPGEGTDFTNLPYESAPPLDVLLQEREMAQKELEELNKSEPKPPITTIHNKKMLIYQSHNYESFLPLLGLPPESDPNKAFDSKTNMTVVGDMLGKALEANGVGAIVDKTNMGAELNKNGWGTEKAYTVSRSIVTSTMASNNEIEYLIDLHRDSSRRDLTTATIHNKPYARVFFVVGSASDNHEKSLAFANKIHKSLESQYPGISRGIFEKGLNEGNGVYNQDLSEHSILIEIGGVDNNMKEIKNTVDALSKVISQYFWDAEKVNSN
ncbi:stage II sporulation protein P [Ferdinandcohnia sp. SAFN-114]|uniref:stage II sporulation protein P n=1 Tax=Ferdinandcohnia sp. SAFN-114 TaxID=3387275 RepID=UPI003F8164EA